MDASKFIDVINSSEYDFLRTNPHLKDRILFITLGGSHAYGTNVETSDIDIRGCALNSRSDILGMSNFEQVLDNKTDTTIYSFNKLISLLINCNPNTIEILGGKPEYYFQISEIGQQLLDNKKLFLSQKAAGSFGGYATQQLRRLENALAHDRLPDEKKLQYTADALNRALKNFENIFTEFEQGSIKIFTDKSNRDDVDSEIFLNVDISKYPAREFQTLINTLSSVVNNYEKLNGRNKKKDEAHLNKHAMHLIRLYLMCLDILEKEEINTYRENDREFLLDIRAGKFQNEDGTYKSEFFDLVSDYDKRLKYAKENTSLPKTPNMKLIEEFVMDVNSKSL